MCVKIKAMNDWDLLARKLGFTSEKHLLEVLYLERELSLSKLSTILGVSSALIHQKLKRYSIERRSRGGANNDRHLSEKLRLWDQRELWLMPSQVCTSLKTNMSVIYRLRKENLNELWNHRT